MPDDVDLKLSADEALVMFGWITRFNQQEECAFADQAEQRVLWDLEAMLESALGEPLGRNYDELLAAARGRVRDPED